MRPIVEVRPEDPPALEVPDKASRYPGVRPAIVECLKAGPAKSTALLHQVEAMGVTVTSNALFYALRALLADRVIVATKWPKVYSLRGKK